MKKSMLILIILILCIGMFGCTAQSPKMSEVPTSSVQATATPQSSPEPQELYFDVDTLRVGDVLGAFTLESLGGDPVRMIRFAGKQSISGEYYIADGDEASDFGDVICLFRVDEASRGLLPLREADRGEEYIELIMPAEDSRKALEYTAGEAQLIIEGYQYMPESQFSGYSARISEVLANKEVEESKIYLP